MCIGVIVVLVKCCNSKSPVSIKVLCSINIVSINLANIKTNENALRAPKLKN